MIAARSVGTGTARDCSRVKARGNMRGPYGEQLEERARADGTEGV